MNSVSLIGRLAADPELKYTPSGIAVCSFRIAVDRQFKDKEGNKQTDWINIVSWRQTAEFIGNYGSKGRLVSVQGALQTRSYANNEGKNITVTEVIADSVNVLDKQKETASGTPSLQAVDVFTDVYAAPDQESDPNVVAKAPVFSIPKTVNSPVTEEYNPFSGE